MTDEEKEIDASEPPTEEQAPAAAEAAPAPAEPAPEVKVVDKRRFARFLGRAASAAPQPAPPAEPEGERLPTFVEELKARAERAEAELKERAERAEARARAEVEAARARLERHYEARLASARAELVEGLLGVLDNLDRALEAPGASDDSLYEGVAATRDLFLKTLGGLGLEAVASVGEPFDPEVHEAVDEVAVADAEEDGKVVAELRRGFRLGDRLVRPAAVRVGRAARAAEGGMPSGA
jgi:molecular chaperone GrpE